MKILKYFFKYTISKQFQNNLFTELSLPRLRSLTTLYNSFICGCLN